MNEREKLVKIELEMLDEIDRICKKYNISYFLDYGSALGAVRHKGFIPWDDDIDISMMRSDYNKFLSIFTKEVDNNKYFLQVYETEPNYHNFHAKIRRKNTIYPQGYTKNFNERGIMLDIFPLDRVPDNEKERKKYIRRVRKYRKICAIVAADIRKNLLKKTVIKILRFLPEEHYRKKYEKMCNKYNDVETCCVTCFSDIYFLKRDICCEIKDILPTKTIEFEGKMYSIMANPNARLKSLYNDYMTLPPVEEQIPHHLIDRIIFDVKEYENNNK